MSKSILDMVHESAKDLHDAGLMKDVTMREFDALCLPRSRSIRQYRSSVFGLKTRLVRVYLQNT